MYSKSIVGIAFLALAGPYLYGRFKLLSFFYANAPHRLPRVEAFQSHEIKFADRAKNCEDAVLVESMGLAILSCDLGRDRWNSVMGIFKPEADSSGQLWLYDYGSPKSQSAEALRHIKLVGFPKDEEFRPLGIDYHEPSSTLVVINLSSSGARIEMFSLSISSNPPTATHKAMLRSASVHAPNSVLALSETEFYFTNDHYFLSKQRPWAAMVETYLGIPGGTVVYHNTLTKAMELVAHLPFANGITALNSTTLAISSTTSAAVYLFDRDPKTGHLHNRRTIKLPFLPDNLSVDTNGALLIAGHPHVPSLDEFVLSRALCRSEEGKDADICKTAVAPSWVSEWTEAGGLKDIYVGTGYPTSATALRDVQKRIGLITGLYADGILVWKY